MLLTPSQFLSSEEERDGPPVPDHRRSHGSPLGGARSGGGGGAVVRMQHLSENNGSAGSAAAAAAPSASVVTAAGAAGSGSSERGVQGSDGSTQRSNGVAVAKEMPRPNDLIAGLAATQSGGQLSQAGAGAGSVAAGSATREKSSQQATGAVTGVEVGQRRSASHQARAALPSQNSPVAESGGGGGNVRGGGNSPGVGVDEGVASSGSGGDAVAGAKAARQNAASRGNVGTTTTSNGGNHLTDGSVRGLDDVPMKTAGVEGTAAGGAAAEIEGARTTAGGGGSVGPGAARGGVPNQGASPSASAATGREGEGQQATLLDKRALQVTLMSLLEDDRFVDMLHARYVALMRRRATRDVK